MIMIKKNKKQKTFFFKSSTKQNKTIKNHKQTENKQIQPNSGLKTEKKEEKKADVSVVR